ncbi:fimbrial protein [Enterobacter sp. HG048]|uniref:fimbrial protein n=1 Tax=unclassified Enterobacter TaxID=2608935 RepID=UPI000A43A8E8|nr:MULTISPECIES: fimbrial protein [unclassified Enterobacter]MCR6469042.1 fimbrial protein [Enterobacter sp. HG048]
MATILGGTFNGICAPTTIPPSYNDLYTFALGQCSITLSKTVYPPVSGYYSLGIGEVYYNGSLGYQLFSSTLTYLDASKPLNSQDMRPGYSVYYFHEYSGGLACNLLKAPDGKIYTLDLGYQLCKINSSPPLPPTPQVDTSCTINSGNALSVSLGSLDRATLPTTPSSGTAKHIKIPVSCTGGDVTVSMNITYTAITIGSTQAVKTSANGVGTAIIYNNAAVTPTSKATINLKSGSNTVDLGFQAIRDSAVAVKDIPTGAFTASAVMVMTQQ